MKKAQQVRTRWLQKYDAAINVEAQKIFNWVLDLMDANTEKGYFGSLDIFSYYDEHWIRVKCQKEAKYDLTDVLLQFDRKKLFIALHNLINNEQGFVVTTNFDDIYYNSKAITLNIEIKCE